MGAPSDPLVGQCVSFGIDAAPSQRPVVGTASGGQMRFAQAGDLPYNVCLGYLDLGCSSDFFNNEYLQRALVLRHILLLPE